MGSMFDKPGNVFAAMMNPQAFEKRTKDVVDSKGYVKRQTYFAKKSDLQPKSTLATAPLTAPLTDEQRKTFTGRSSVLGG